MSGTVSPALARFLQSAGEALRRGDIQGAMTLADQAAAQGLEDPNLFTLAGQLRMRRGQPDKALPILLRAREMAPDNIEALNALGVCLAMLGDAKASLEVFDDALAKAPDTIYLHLHRAQPLEMSGRLREAQAALERVIAAQPSNAQALEQLASLCARRGDMAATREYATRALKSGPLAGAIIALAMADIEEGQYQAAQRALIPLAGDPRIGPVNQAIANTVLGDALDADGKPAEAFGAYIASREILRGPMTQMLAGQESAGDRVRRLAAYFRGAPDAPWRANAASAPASPVKTHAFLVGFPRSGTTLLEQALKSHPQVRTMEETDCLGDTVGKYFFATDGMESFAALDETALDVLRAEYWERVQASGAQTDRAVFLDKMPLNSVHQGLIARLFPNAKILFALRDPRDVVLSCFRRRLVMTAHMFELSRLDAAANFYDAVMDLSLLYRDKLGLTTLDTRHEDMIADFEGELRRVCAFLGLEYDAAMADFARHARERDIKTPSALQIVRGLNTDGAGQWKRFAAQMAPVLPTLQPWALRFGYEA